MLSLKKIRCVRLNKPYALLYKYYTLKLRKNQIFNSMMYQSLRPPAVTKDLRMQAPGVSPLFKGSQGQLTENFFV